jgi:energy-coupling factor transport system ATP-binding protein
VSLSGGEQQRVAIASVLVMGGPVLVLDEPTAQLDPAATELVAEVLVELAARGHAILVADHDDAVLGRTQRVIVLDGGRVVASGAPGIALAATVLGPLGLSEPDIVRLAAAANVSPAQALDEEAVAAGLEHARAASLMGPVPPQPSSPAALLHVAAEPGPTWSPVRTVPAPVLEVRELVHRYRNGIEAVRGVSLRIEPGETVAIIGQNGSGKTTLVKHLNGLLRPTTGSVHHDGRDITDRRVHELAGTVGFVFQNPDDQVFNRTVERELAFGPRNLRMDRELIDDLIRHALEVTGLESVRGANPYDLGTSERKLVALAGILAMDPPVLVLDEPTTGQDGPGVARVGRVVDAWAGAGRTVVAITHDMAFAARHFGRIVVMRLGEVVADGPPADVFARDRVDLLASTGLRPPAAVRIAHRLGLEGIVGVDDLLQRVFRPTTRAQGPSGW